MENQNKNNTTTGISFTGILTIVFIILKLVKVIDWSWWWVLSPIWISVGVGGLLSLIIYLVVRIVAKKKY